MSSTHEPAIPEQPRSRWRLVVLFVLSQVIVLGVILELAARIFDPLGISYYPETAHLLDAMIIEEPIGYRLRPGLEGRFHRAEVKINQLGMRDRPVAPEKEPGEFRILMIGDSVFFSIGVDYEDSIPAQTERLANLAAPPGRHYRTLNMGVPSYNTERELTQLEQLGLSLQPDAAVMLLVGNDLQSKMWVFEKRSGLAANLAQRSYGASLSYLLLNMWLDRLIYALTPASDVVEPVAAIEPAAANPRYAEIESALIQIHRKLQGVGARFLLIHHFTVDDELVEIVRAAGRREGFAVRGFDIWADPRWQDLDPLDYRNSKTDSHCNPKGCVIYATSIFESMVDSGLLD